MKAKDLLKPKVKPDYSIPLENARYWKSILKKNVVFGKKTPEIIDSAYRLLLCSKLSTEEIIAKYKHHERKSV